MLRLYDTRLREVVDIVPVKPGILSIYACGPTVYKPQHVGNLRSSLFPDLIGRVASWHGLQVRFVQNITDVGHLDEESGEDKMIAEAQRRGLSPLEIAREIEALFKADGEALGYRPAMAHPRATEYVPQMIAMTEKLIELGHAYESGGSVWYDARSFDSYGEVSNNRIDELDAGASGRLSSEEESLKRFHADWALWRGVGFTDEAVTFDSPWGRGVPGWHIECSAMSLDLLGDAIDIHTGGIDLRFPHHEDERAQSNPVAGKDVIHHWVHGEHLLSDGKKMAKSTGNVVLLSDVVERGLDPLAVRLFFLTAHYRTQSNLTWKALEDADKRLQVLRRKVAEWAESPSAPVADAYVERVVAAFDDDLSTPAALAALSELVRDPAVSPGSKFETAVKLDRLFGLDLMRHVGQPPPALPAGAREKLAERETARAAKDFATSDRLRDELAAVGVKVADTPDGQAWTLA
ncbi:MAG TPA: cysteine--tRNA ligase [Mycobacteriales bacterium]|nr:cysteine--tRNA ligase [Mycobacteriales bacterium]